MVNRVIGFRLSDVIVERIDGLAARYGISRAAVVSLAVSRFWEQEGCPLPDVQEPQGIEGVAGVQDAWRVEGAEDAPDREAAEVQALLRKRAKQERKKKQKRGR